MVIRGDGVQAFSRLRGRIKSGAASVRGLKQNIDFGYVLTAPLLHGNGRFVKMTDGLRNDNPNKRQLARPTGKRSIAMSQVSVYAV